MRILGNPMPGDDRVTSGESGASAFGAVAAILSEPELAGIKEELGLDENSRVLFFSTEGDTDRENYRRIVWEGSYSKKHIHRPSRWLSFNGHSPLFLA
jgi:diaminopropionate ammonia-lyase